MEKTLYREIEQSQVVIILSATVFAICGLWD
jgi:hypothetical protein